MKIAFFVRRIIFSTVACLAGQGISTLSHKGFFFEKKNIGNKICVLILSTTLCEIILTLRRIRRDIITNVHKSSCKVFVMFVGY
jgi:hypothetical protein